jgi:uncharacterized membrane protein YeaQ/YmgE (transglycosylase-associated protein family)
MHSLAAFLSMLIMGLIAGWLAAALTDRKGLGIVGYIVLGIVGSFLGEIIFEIAGLTSIHIIGHLIISVVGSILVLWLVSFLSGSGKKK